MKGVLESPWILCCRSTLKKNPYFLQSCLPCLLASSLTLASLEQQNQLSDRTLTLVSLSPLNTKLMLSKFLPTTKKKKGSQGIPTTVFNPALGFKPLSAVSFYIHPNTELFRVQAFSIWFLFGIFTTQNGSITSEFLLFI